MWLQLAPMVLAAQTSYTWNGSASSAWNNAANWTPNSGFPLAADHATIVAAGNMPVLDMARSVTNITVTSGSLDLNGLTLTSTGNGAFNGGTVNNGTFAANSAGSMNFAGTTFGATITGNTGVLQFNGGTYNGPVTLTKTGAGFEYWHGTQSFNATLTLTATAGRLYPAYSGTTAFNGNVLVNSTGGSGGIWIGQNTGTATLAAGRTFSVGGGGFSIGSLAIRNLTQAGTTPQSLVLTGTSTLYLQTGTTFNADVEATTPGLYLNGATFNGLARFTKTGTASEYSSGGNVFQGTLELLVTGSGILNLTNTGVDTFNGDLLVGCTGTGGIRFGVGTGSSVLHPARTLAILGAGYTNGLLELRRFDHAGTLPTNLVMGSGSIFNIGTNSNWNGPITVSADRIYLSSTTFQGACQFTKNSNDNDWSAGGCIFNADLELLNTGNGILGLHNTGNDTFNGDVRVGNLGTGSVRFGNGTGTSALAAGRTLAVSSAGYNSGLFMLRGMTQAGATVQTITVGPAVNIHYGPGCAFGGDLITSAGGFYITGNTFNGACRFTKLASSTEASVGNNTFNGPAEFNNNSTGSFLMTDAGSDQFNGDITVNCVAGGQVRFGSNGGTGTLAAGRTIAAGVGGYNGTLLLLANFTQLGTVPVVINLSAASVLFFYPGNTFNAPVTTVSGGVYVAGSTFHGNCHFTKTGPSSDTSPGGNTFNGSLEIVNTTAASLILGASQQDQLNGNVLVNNTGTGQVRFGNSPGGGAVLASGRTIAVGSLGFDAGMLMLRDFIQLGGTPQHLNLGNAAMLYLYQGTVFNADLTVVAGSFILWQGTYHGQANFTKTNTGTETSIGGNIFHQRLELTNTQTGALYLAETAGDQYNGDVVVNNLSTGQIRFGNGASVNSTLAAGRTITVGAGGFNAGLLMLRRFTQVGPTPQHISLGSAAALYLYQGSSFDGDLVTTSGSLLLGGTTFNATSKFTKTGNGGDGSPGGCVFHGATEFINTGSGNLSLDYTGADAFNGNLMLNSTGTGQINFGQNGGSATLAAGRTITVGSLGFATGTLVLRNFTQTGSTPQNLLLGTAAVLYYNPGTVFNGNLVSTSGSLLLSGSTFNGTCRFTKTASTGDGSPGNCVFNGHTELILTAAGNLSLNYTGTDAFNSDLVVNCTANGQVNFGQNGGSATLAAGRTITVGSLGFNAGGLFLRNFTQAGGTPQNLVLGTAAALYYYPGTVFNGNIVSTSGSLYFSGATFNGTGRFTKSGTSGDGSPGNCVFNGNAEFILTAVGNLSLNYNGTDAFNGDLVVNNTSTGQVNFGQNGGSATLAAGRTITVGSLGFNSGSLYLRNFTQLGTTPQTLMLGTAASMYFQTGSTFHGNMTSSGGNMFLNGSVFNGMGWFRKTGATNNSNNGGNVFNAQVELVCTGAGVLYMNNNGTDLYQGDLLLNCTSGGGIDFGNNTGTATVSTGEVRIGSTGFTNGTFTFRNFTQAAPSAINSITGGYNVRFNPNTVFNGQLTVVAQHLLFNGATFNGISSFTKNGAGNNSCPGGNFFNGDSEFRVQAGLITMAVNAPDVFNGNAHFIRTGSGSLVVNNTYNATFYKNVSTVGSASPVSFGAGAGRTIFAGPAVQTFSSDAGLAPLVRNLTLNKSGGTLDLLGDVVVTLDLAFTNGVIRPQATTSTGAGLLILNAGITFSDPADNTSHVDGFVRKIGNTAFSFPVGNAGVLAPVAISAPGQAAHHFTAKYVHADPDPLYDDALRDFTLHHLSNCEYWVVDRTNSTTNVTVTLAFDSVRSCGVTSLTDLVVARWNGSTWKDHGNGGTTGALASGTIVTAGPVTAFSPFTLASRNASNPLPIELVEFSAVEEGTAVLTTWTTATETDNDHFVVERSADAMAFEAVGTVDGAGSSQALLNYAYTDEAPLPGTSYYRLKQVDINGAFSYSDMEPVVRQGGTEALRIWPNPVVGQLHLAMAGVGQVTSVQVHDAAGRMVLHRAVDQVNGTLDLDLDGVPPGVLFLSVFLDNGTVQQERFLKQ